MLFRSLTGVLNREGTFVYPLSAAGMEYRTMKEVIREIGPSELELLDHISGLPPYEVSNAAPLEDIKIMAPIPVQYPCQLLFIYGIGQKLHKALLTGFLADAFREAHFFLDLSKGLVGEIGRLFRVLLDHLIQIFFVLAKICKPVLERL